MRVEENEKGWDKWWRSVEENSENKRDRKRGNMW